MLKIWGRTNSGNVQKVLWALGELGVSFERFDIGMEFGGNDQPEYLAMNPNGVIPTIDDDGFILWESNACVRYLASKYGHGTLYPADLQARAEADRWMDWQQTTLLWAFIEIFWGLVRTPPEERDNKLIETKRQETIRCYRILEQSLAGRDFVAGADFTMGDIPIGAFAYRWFALDLERPSMPNVEAWYARLCERAPFQAHIMQPLS